MLPLKWICLMFLLCPMLSFLCYTYALKLLLSSNSKICSTFVFCKDVEFNEQTFINSGGLVNSNFKIRLYNKFTEEKINVKQLKKNFQYLNRKVIIFKFKLTHKKGYLFLKTWTNCKCQQRAPTLGIFGYFVKEN